jgi:hypothetical protein
MSDPIIEAARALEAVFPDDIDREDAIKLAAAVTPLIRAAALEEAAVVAEECEPSRWPSAQRGDIAAAIRALKPTATSSAFGGVVAGRRVIADA